MIPRKSVLSCIALMTVATSCTNDLEPEFNYGVIRVTVTTVGGDLDDKYSLVVGSAQKQLPANATYSVILIPGKATVELSDVASNCDVDGSRTRSVDVPRGNTVDVEFQVTCLATGFRISVATSGEDMPDSYALAMTGKSPMPVAVNSSLLVSRLEPGPYVLSLTSPIANCTLKTAAELSVDLPPRTVVPVTFEVACGPVVRLEKVAFELDSTEAYLALARPDGTEERVIREGASPSWSRDGKELAYSDFDCTSDDFDGGYLCAQVVRAIDPETLRIRYLADGSMAAWSPTDDVVALVRPNGRLAIVGTKSARSTVLYIPDSLVSANPSWSPDGQSIAFACHSPNAFSRLCVINSDGTGFRQLTDSSSNPASHPVWSYDGRTIAFTSTGVEGIAIAKIPVEGGAISTLAEGFDPARSRDGTKLVFARVDGLFTMNPDGTDVQRLTTGRHRAPAWRPLE